MFLFNVKVIEWKKKRNNTKINRLFDYELCANRRSNVYIVYTKATDTLTSPKLYGPTCLNSNISHGIELLGKFAVSQALPDAKRIILRYSTFGYNLGCDGGYIKYNTYVYIAKIFHLFPPHPLTFVALYVVVKSTKLLSFLRFFVRVYIMIYSCVDLKICIFFALNFFIQNDP